MASIKGVADVSKALAEMAKRVPQATLAGLVKGGLIIKSESQKLVPRAYGNLANSAFVTWPDGTDENARFTGKEAQSMTSQHNGVMGQMKGLTQAGEKPQVVVGYSAVYALSVHENPNAGSGKGFIRISQTINARAKTSLNVSAKARERARGVATTGQWKYLQTAIDGTRDRVSKAIATTTKGAMKK